VKVERLDEVQVLTPMTFRAKPGAMLIRAPPRPASASAAGPSKGPAMSLCSVTGYISFSNVKFLVFIEQ
jgi:hypothetical protein